MEFVNRMEIRGVIVSDVEIKTYNDKRMIQMRVVTNRAYNTKEGPKVEPTYHNVCAWEGNKIRDMFKIHKGDNVCVIGRCRQHVYKNKDGKSITIMEIVAESMRKLTGNIEYVNRIEIRGVIVSPIDLKTINDRHMIQMRVVTNFIYNTQEGPQIEETYHNIMAWEGNKIRDMFKIHKGDFVCVIGRYRLNTYTNKEGRLMSNLEVATESMRKLS